MQSVPTSAEAAPEPAPEPTQDPPTGRPVAAGRTALALIAASTVVLAVVMGLGPSATVPPLDSGGPMGWLAARPSAATVIALERAGLLVGAIGVAMGLVAARRGWRPATGLLLGAGAAAAAVYIFLPPAGSIDVLNYAIYGRIASLGHNPYLMRPSELYRSGDAVGLFAPSNWRTLPTIYGPVATGVQWAAARLGGGSMARIVFWIRFANAVAFVAAAAGLVRLAGADRARQARVCLLWAVNPLMLFWLVGSGHVDVLPALLVVASLITIRGLRVANGAVTGALIGVATAIKTPFILAAGGLFWAARRSPRTVIAGRAGPELPAARRAEHRRAQPSAQRERRVHLPGSRRGRRAASPVRRGRSWRHRGARPAADLAAARWPARVGCRAASDRSRTGLAGRFPSADAMVRRVGLPLARADAMEQARLSRGHPVPAAQRDSAARRAGQLRLPERRDCGGQPPRVGRACRPARRCLPASSLGWRAVTIFVASVGKLFA